MRDAKVPSWPHGPVRLASPWVKHPGFREKRTLLPRPERLFTCRDRRVQKTMRLFLLVRVLPLKGPTMTKLLTLALLAFSFTLPTWSVFCVPLWLWAVKALPWIWSTAS